MVTEVRKGDALRVDSEAALPPETQDALANDILRRFVDLIIFARRGNGTWDETTALSSFYIAFSRKDSWCVRINDESTFWSAPRAAHDLPEGGQMLPEDVISTPAAPPAEALERFISGARSDDGWTLSFKLNEPHPDRDRHLDAAEEFRSVAEMALERGHLRAFHENSFHAAEHLAKAELMSYAPAVPEIADSRTHGRLRSAYQLWAHLGNTDGRFARLLQQLEDDRSAITYAHSDRLLDRAHAKSQLAVLLEMAAWVRSVANGDGPASISLWATRAISAGELVFDDSASLRPPKS